MSSFFITLVQKIQLTHDVYELIYTTHEDLCVLPGQFLLCSTDAENSKLRRSYSISDYADGILRFIIKKIPDGKGGSKAICDQEIWHSMQVWWPMGTFVLPKEVTKKVVFIGTGTGFAPLYLQAKYLLATTRDISIKFLFGVREERDLFYEQELSQWSHAYPHFSYQFCLSQSAPTPPLSYPGRVTDYLRDTPEATDECDTLYSLCGSPAMVHEVREILASKNIAKEHIFFEQY